MDELPEVVVNGIEYGILSDGTILNEFIVAIFSAGLVTGLAILAGTWGVSVALKIFKTVS
jgi:hypothetical protein